MLSRVGVAARNDPPPGRKLVREARNPVAQVALRETGAMALEAAAQLGDVWPSGSAFRADLKGSFASWSGGG
jgi:hypothetical protein